MKFAVRLCVCKLGNPYRQKYAKGIWSRKSRQSSSAGRHGGGSQPSQISSERVCRTRYSNRTVYQHHHKIVKFEIRNHKLCLSTKLTKMWPLRRMASRAQ